MNSCTDGFRIEDFTILTEKVPETKAQFKKWVDFYQPASPGEWELCEMATAASVQRKRILKIKKSRIDKQINKARLAYDQAQEDSLARARELHRTSPAEGIVAIKRLAIGCRFLLERFRRLATLVEEDGTLLGNDVDELISYMGAEPYIDRLFLSEGAYLTRLSCAVSKGGPTQEEIEGLGDVVMPTAMRDRATHTWLGPRPLHRAILKQIIDGQITELTRREEQLRAYEDFERDRAEDSAAELTDHDGELLSRYQHMHESAWHRAYNALVSGRERAAKTGRIPGEPGDANCDSPGDVSSSQEATPVDSAEPDLTPDPAAEEAAAERREAAAALRPGETNGIGAPIYRGDWIIRVIRSSRWWDQLPEGLPPHEKRVEGVNLKPPDPALRE
jgi:hypothetical protein